MLHKHICIAKTTIALEGGGRLIGLDLAQDKISKQGNSFHRSSRGGVLTPQVTVCRKLLKDWEILEL